MEPKDELPIDQNQTEGEEINPEEADKVSGGGGSYAYGTDFSGI